MRLRSEWYFDCEPQHIWPHFLKAEMDDSRPLMFRLGVTVPNRKDKNGRYMLQEGMPVKAVILAKKR